MTPSRRLPFNDNRKTNNNGANDWHVIMFLIVRHTFYHFNDVSRRVRRPRRTVSNDYRRVIWYWQSLWITYSTICTRYIVYMRPFNDDVGEHCSPLRLCVCIWIYIRCAGVVAPYTIYCAIDYIRRCCLSQRAHELRNTVMLRLRRWNHMCSSTVADTANRLRKTR